ncbi:MAG: tetratricopeptide repeat protein [Deltaproteobacteria bacterium]|nr:tetratricopeptide repeat protein [Deltaproteobacteria bacterium]
MAYRCCIWLTLACAVSGCGKLRARSAVKAGNAYYQEGKLDLALEQFERAVSFEPSLALAHLHLGYSCIGLMQGATAQRRDQLAPKALKAFEHYIALRPDDERGPRYYLKVLSDAGQHDRALAYLERRHRQSPGDLRIITSLGLIASRAGKLKQAISWYEKRAEMLPKDPKARYLIGTAVWQHLYQNEQVVGGERLALADRGIEALKRAEAIAADDVQTLTYINLLYRERAKGQTTPEAREQDIKLAEQYRQRAMAKRDR